MGLNMRKRVTFLDDLEMVLLTSGRDEDNVKVKVFLLVLRDAAKTWFQGLSLPRRKLIGIRLRKLF